MKQFRLLPFLFLFLALLAACSKGGGSGGGGSQTPGTLYPSTVTVYGYQTGISITLVYDASHRIAGFSETDNDSSGSSPVSSTVTYTFNLPASGPPTGYTVTNPLYGSSTGTLLYDAQGRIIEDTSLDGSGDVVYYSYPSSSTISYAASYGTDVTVTLSGGNIVTNDETDSSAVAGGGNVLQFGYSSLANPLYNSTIEPSMGIWFYSNVETQAMDFVSQNMFNHVNDNAGNDIGLTLSQDSQGRVTQAAGGSGQNSIRIVYTY